MSALVARCVRLDQDSADAALELLERESLGCYCRFHHFRGDKNAWHARVFHEPQENAREFRAMSLEPGLHGMVALGADGGALGWMKIAPQRALSKIYEQRLYRGLPCFDGPREGVFTIGCFLVDERFRRRGVGRALLKSALEQARAEGARFVEAFPRGVQGVPDAELWTGPLAMFLTEGFEVVHDFPPYPVLRLAL